MHSTRAFAALAILAASYATALAATRAPLHAGSRIVIRHATVIAGTDAPPARDMTVVVENGRITDIAPASRGVSESRSGYTTRSVDARGRYLIPGLWDMHAHLDDVETLPLNAPDSAKALQLPLFVLQGVTGVRDMGGRLEVLSRWRDSIAAGQLVGPRIVACGPLLDGAPPFWPGSIGIRDAAAGRRAVDSLQRAGAAFIKVYSFLTRDAYFGIADEARRAGIPFDGHVPDSVTVVEASDAGQRTQEHLLRMLHATGDADSAKRALEATHARGGLQRYLVETTALLDTYDSTRAAAVYARFAANHTWQSPTLINTYLEAYEEADSITARRIVYMPQYIRRWWNRSTNPHTRVSTPALTALRRRDLEQELLMVRQMHRAGVRFVAGTDQGGNPTDYAGFSLHDDLALYVRAGFTPLEALQTATRNAAQLLGMLDSVGTIENGKVADMVLLNANPLDDIRSVSRVYAVVLNGRLIDADERRRRLADLEQQARAY